MIDSTRLTTGLEWNESEWMIDSMRLRCLELINTIINGCFVLRSPRGMVILFNFWKVLISQWKFVSTIFFFLTRNILLKKFVSYFEYSNLEISFDDVIFVVFQKTRGKR